MGPCQPLVRWLSQGPDAEVVLSVLGLCCCTVMKLSYGSLQRKQGLHISGAPWTPGFIAANLESNSFKVRFPLEISIYERFP